MPPKPPPHGNGNGHNGTRRLADTVTAALDSGYGRMVTAIGQLGWGVVIAWALWYGATVVMPESQAAYREELREERVRALAREERNWALQREERDRHREEIREYRREQLASDKILQGALMALSQGQMEILAELKRDQREYEEQRHELRRLVDLIDRAQHQAPRKPREPDMPKPPEGKKP